MPRPTMSLTAAREANGLETDDPRYEGVKVSVAPRWLQDVWIGPVRAMTLYRAIYVSEEWFERIAEGQARRLLTHESVHVEQWRRHGRIGYRASDVDQDRLGSVHAASLDLDTGRGDGLHILGQQLGDSVGVLIGHQAHGDLGSCPRRQYCLGSVTLIATENHMT